MLACNTLRITRDDDSAVADYRIEDDRVESRILYTATEGSSATENRWYRLTAEQLSSHIMRDTVVARWLHRRMGVHPLIRACSQHFSSANEAEQTGQAKWRREKLPHHALASIV